MKNVKEIVMKYVFMVSAAASILAVFLICVFLFANGVPAMREVGFLDFLFGTKWAPSNVPASFSIFPMIVGSIYVTAGAIIVGVPIGILTAVFMARFFPQSLQIFILSMPFFQNIMVFLKVRHAVSYIFINNSKELKSSIVRFLPLCYNPHELQKSAHIILI